jgi:outer membrane lipoprotein SlyB
MKYILSAAALAAVATLSACSTTNPDVVQRGDAQRLSLVQDATVLSVRPVVVDGTQSGIGGTAGAVTGAIAGSSVGGRREGQVVGVIGAVVGAVVGNAIERSATREEAVEILLQMRNGERRSVVQAKGEENFAAGEAVILTTTGGKTRVTRAPVVQQSAARPAPTPGQ